MGIFNPLARYCPLFLTYQVWLFIWVPNVRHLGTLTTLVLVGQKIPGRKVRYFGHRPSTQGKWYVTI